jgi:hypothetical protein
MGMSDVSASWNRKFWSMITDMLLCVTATSGIALGASTTGDLSLLFWLVGALGAFGLVLRFIHGAALGDN